MKPMGRMVNNLGAVSRLVRLVECCFDGCLGDTLVLQEPRLRVLFAPLVIVYKWVLFLLKIASTIGVKIV